MDITRKLDAIDWKQHGWNLSEWLTDIESKFDIQDVSEKKQD